MRSLLLRSMIASALFLGACTASNSTPATAPETVAPEPATTVATTTTLITLAPTTTAQAPTTTVDRTAEIEAIFQDLEQRRLTALYEGDREAFAALFANDAYLQRSLGAFEVVSFSERPTAAQVAVLRVLVDSPDCIAAMVAIDAVPELVGSERTEHSTVLERRTEGVWGLSYVGRGWECSGEHPLSP